MAVETFTVERTVKDTMYRCSDGREMKNQLEAERHEFLLVLRRMFPGRELKAQEECQRLYHRFTRHQRFLIELDAAMSAKSGGTTASAA